VNGNKDQDSTVHVWDADKSVKLTTLLRPGLTRGAQFVGATHRMLGWSGSLERRGYTVWLHDFDARRDVFSLPHPQPVTGAAFSQDSRHLLTWARDGVRLWNVSNTPSLTYFNATTDWVEGAYFTTPGNEVVSFGRDKYARIWPTLEGKPATVFFHEGEPFGVTQAHLLTDGNVLTLANASARLWSRSGQLRRVFARRWTGNNEPLLSGMIVDEPNQLLITWEQDRVQLWNLRSGGLITELLLHDWVSNYGIQDVLKPSTGPVIVWSSIALLSFSLDVDGELDVPDSILAWEARTGVTLDPFGALRSLTRAEWNERRRQPRAMK
jgi:WD40 repeat protein